MPTVTSLRLQWQSASSWSMVTVCYAHEGDKLTDERQRLLEALSDRIRRAVEQNDLATVLDSKADSQARRLLALEPSTGDAGSADVEGLNVVATLRWLRYL